MWLYHTLDKYTNTLINSHPHHTITYRQTQKINHSFIFPRYSTPPKGEAAVRLLSSEDDDDADFDDATDDEDDILQVVSRR